MSSVTPSFLLLNCNQHDKMQLFAELKRKFQRGFRATLSLRKVKVALNPFRYIIQRTWGASSVVNIFKHGGPFSTRLVLTGALCKA